LGSAILVQGCKSTWILHARTLPRWVANCTQGQRICRFVVNAFKGRVFYSNINSQRQVLVGGIIEDLPAVEATLKEERIAYKRIQGNKPFHTLI